MYLEELKSKVNNELGSTQLTLSERTVNEELEDALDGIEDSAVDDAFIGKIVKRLKRMDGNLHKEVGEQNRKYREKFEEDWKKKNGNQFKKNDNEGNDEPEWFKAYREQQEQKLQELENARKQESAEAYKKEIAAKVEKALKAKFSAADIEPNPYVLRTTLNGMTIPEKDADVNELVKEMENTYNANWKELGLDDDTPRYGCRGGGNGTNAAIDDFFAKKKKKENWGKK